MMKIIFLIPDNVAGGAERVMTSIANELAIIGHDIYLINFSGTNDFYSLNNMVHNIGLNINDAGKRGVRKYILFPKYYNALYSCLINIKPDAVISFIFMTNIVGVICCHQLKIKIFISERNDPNRYTWLQSKFMKLFYPMADGFVCQSDIVKTIVEKRYGIRNCIVIPNPLTREQVNIPATIKKNIIIAVGRLIPQKNFAMLIAAFSELEEIKNNYRLIIYGDGPLRTELERQITDLRLRDKVFLPGIKKDAIKIHNDATLFILSSDFEGYPNVLVEAMANGIPSIASDVPSGTVRELIKDGENGFIFPIRDKEKLKEKIRYSLSDKCDLKAIGNAAVEVYSRNKVSKIAIAWLNYIRTNG